MARLARVWNGTAWEEIGGNSLQLTGLSVPLGTVVPYAGGTTAPSGWLLCDGRSTAGTALASLISNTPDLRNRFVVGAGSTYAQNAQGGAATVTLTAAQSGMRNHNHGGATGSMNRNTSHAHNARTSSAPSSGGWDGVEDAVRAAYSSNFLDNQYVTSNDTNHEHSITAQADANATASHENLPPYYALVYIIAAELVQPL